MNPADSRDELRAAAETVVAMRRTRGRLTPGVLDDLERSLATPAPTASLDAAFGEVESLLPEGWSFWEVTGHPEYEREGTVHPARVFARVRLANIIDSHGMVPEASASGPTILAALRLLRDAEGERRGSEPPLPGTWPELRDA